MSTATVAVVPVDPELAKRLRRDATMIDRWTAAREADIREAREAGASYREIAELVGLSHVGVMKILGRSDFERLRDAGVVEVIKVTDPEDDHL